VAHGQERSCSSVIERVATRKPGKFFMALRVQKQRCKEQAAAIMNDPDLMSQYQEERRKNRRNTNNSCA